MHLATTQIWTRFTLATKSSAAPHIYMLQTKRCCFKNIVSGLLSLSEAVILPLKPIFGICESLKDKIKTMPTTYSI